MDFNRSSNKPKPKGNESIRLIDNNSDGRVQTSQNTTNSKKQDKIRTSRNYDSNIGKNYKHYLVNSKK